MYFFFFFFFNNTATPEISPLSLHDALPISQIGGWLLLPRPFRRVKQPPGKQTDVEPVFAGIKIDRFFFRREQIEQQGDRKSTRLNSSHSQISYAVFCLKKKKKIPCQYIMSY